MVLGPRQQLFTPAGGVTCAFVLPPQASRGTADVRHLGQDSSLGHDDTELAGQTAIKSSRSRFWDSGSEPGTVPEPDSIPVPEPASVPVPFQNRTRIPSPIPSRVAMRLVDSAPHFELRKLAFCAPSKTKRKSGNRVPVSSLRALIRRNCVNCPRVLGPIVEPNSYGRSSEPSRILTN